ncbi:hypothetical protein [Ciceribacter naphthalenivorans]|uniref:Uncharacterized protein n=1 Tax=Sphingomonas psychrolutea TaxID=1259676 RepID=A0ABQ6EHB9_9SPHN|nr:hypothetical protein [Ciceribacter naphthalenivorans]GLR24302.1 hypothetical protein GCM10007920_40960 [Ciceribacter naphthalenivorans]GLT07158.1 hypothetical protein GCM10007926_40960 [Sphingomonas psychrolutea]
MNNETKPIAQIAPGSLSQLAVPSGSSFRTNVRLLNVLVLHHLGN